jgi:hypothetical protein
MSKSRSKSNKKVQIHEEDEVFEFPRDKMTNRELYQHNEELIVSRRANAVTQSELALAKKTYHTFVVEHGKHGDAGLITLENMKQNQHVGGLLGAIYYVIALISKLFNALFILQSRQDRLEEKINKEMSMRRGTRKNRSW